jgi:hypothetical protein
MLLPPCAVRMRRSGNRRSGQDRPTARRN